MREVKKHEWMQTCEHAVVWRRTSYRTTLTYTHKHNTVVLKSVNHPFNFVRMETENNRRFILTESEANAIIVTRFI